MLVRSLVSELHDLHETLTLEQLSAVASSLVVVLPLLGEQSGEAGQEHDAAESQEQGGQEAPDERLHFICSSDVVHDLAATLPGLANDAVSQHPLPAVLAPVCQAYGSMLQLLQLTHTDPQARHPGALTLEGAKVIVALYGFLSRTVLCAPRLARQLGHVGMKDLHAAVQVAVRYRLAVPADILDVPPSFWDAVRQRIYELVGAAREGAAAVGVSAAEVITAGQGSRAAGLDARLLAEVLGALCRDLAARREVERASGGGDKEAKGPGGAEAAWLLGTTALLLRSQQAGAQDRWSELNAAVESVQGQLAEAQRDLNEAERKRRACQARTQQQRQAAAGKKGGKAAAKQPDEQQGGVEAAEERALMEGVLECQELVKIAEAEVEDAVGKLRDLGVACMQQQLEVGVLLQLTKEAAEAAGQAGAGGAALGVALEGLLMDRMLELQPVALVQVGTASAPPGS